MYSRYPERPIRVPEHYSGCAFPGGNGGTGEQWRTPTEPTKREPAVPSRVGSSTYPRPTPLPQNGAAPTGSLQGGSRQNGERKGILPGGVAEGTNEKSTQPESSAPEQPANAQVSEEKSPSPALLLSAPGKAEEKRETTGKGLQGLLHGTSFPFSEGMEFDELLILGIMLLLSRNDGDPDLLPLLALLLFCG